MKKFGSGYMDEEGGRIGAFHTTKGWVVKKAKPNANLWSGRTLKRTKLKSQASKFMREY